MNVLHMSAGIYKESQSWSAQTETASIVFSQFWLQSQDAEDVNSVASRS